MMAMSKKTADQEPGEIEALLPWHAAGIRAEAALDRAFERGPAAPGGLVP